MARRARSSRRSCFIIWLDGVGAAEFGPAAWLWNVLHQVGAFPVGTSLVIVGYPLIPWIAIMALGFCFGPAFALPADARQRLFDAARRRR